MSRKIRHDPTSSREGFTLIELTMAVAIFLVVLGATAQGLVSYYAIIATQHQRTVAIQDAKGILSQMRQLRDANPDEFPDSILAVFPDGLVIEDQGNANLPQQIIRITYTDITENPLEAMVQCTWRDAGGRTSQVQISTRITDE